MSSEAQTADQQQDGESIDDRVIRMMADSLGKKAAELRPDLRLVEDLKADSVDRMTLLMVLEKEYDAEIPDEDLAAMITVSDVCVYARTRLARG